MTGFHLIATGPGFHVFTVDQVMPTTPAEKQGIHVGDQIDSVDGTSSAELTLDDLDRIFRRSGTLHLKVRRDGKVLKATLKLKPLI